MANTLSDRNKNLDFDYLVVFLWRRKWIILFSFMVIFFFLQLYLLWAPRIYRAKVVLSIVPQRVPSSYIRSTISGDMEAFMHSIWQEITSRTNLERLIKEFNLYPAMVRAVPMETVVEKMRKSIKILRPRGGKRNVFVMSFEYNDPRLAARVANGIANIFIEENLRLREGQAKTITSFLDEELNRIEQEIKVREMAIQKYKQMYMSELPEQKDSIIAILSRLQKESETLQMRKEMLQDRRIVVLDQLKKMQDQARLNGEPADSSIGGNISQLERLYMALQMKYTDKHPDVVRLKKLIEQRKKEAALSSNEWSLQNRDDPVAQLKMQLKNIEKEIQRIEEVNNRILEKMRIYQQRLENIPKREQELKDLTRDYSNLMKTYRMLLDKKIQATMAETLEKRQQGEQFKVIDPARVPEVPVSPDIKKLLTVGFIFALGVGVALAFLIEFFIDKKVYDPSILEAQLDLKVLATIPMVILPKQKRMKFLKNCLLAMAAIIGVFLNAVLFLRIYATLYNSSFNL